MGERRTVSKGISVMWNENRLIQDLNLVSRAHFLRHFLHQYATSICPLADFINREIDANISWVKISTENRDVYIRKEFRISVSWDFEM